MSTSQTFTVRGFKLRSASRRRFVVVAVQPEGYEYTIPHCYDPATHTYETRTFQSRAGASIIRRSDNLRTAQKEALKYGYRRGGAFAVVIDQHTGQEV